MKDPDQIDQLIREEMEQNRKLAADAERSMNYHNGRVNQLKGWLMCDHRPERTTGDRWHCKCCGFAWREA